MEVKWEGIMSTFNYIQDFRSNTPYGTDSWVTELIFQVFFP